MLTMFDCGIRRDEAFTIERDRIKEHTLIVMGKGGEREVPVSDAIREQLLDMLPWPWKSVESAGQLVRRAHRQAGVTGQRSSSHTLRVTWTRLADMDKVAKKAAGGWKSWTMLEHYLGDITEDAIRQHRAGTPLHLLD
jgi:integrase